MADEELIDLLLELQHDLGKYLRLPLSMLPENASDTQLREALARALRQTRKGPAGVRSAREIYDGFERELGTRLQDSAALAALRDAVQRALAWEWALDGDAAARAEAGIQLDRPTLTAELGAVAEAIAVLIAEQREALTTEQREAPMTEQREALTTEQREAPMAEQREALTAEQRGAPIAEHGEDDGE